MQAKDWDYYWNRPYARYEKHQQWFWDNAYPFVNSPVLDLGCGPASIWKDTNYDVTGVDYSPRAIQEAKRNVPQGNFQVADAVSYIPDRQFSTVISCGLVHYFLPKRINEIRDAHLRGNPKRVIITLNTNPDLNLFKDWGKLVFATFKDRVGWLLVFDRY